MTISAFSAATAAVVGARDDVSLPLRGALIALGVGDVRLHADGDELRDLLGQGAVDVVFIDLGIAEPNPVDLVREIRAEGQRSGRGVSIACIAGDRCVERVRDAVQAGADEVLPSPVRPIDVFRCMVAAVGEPLPKVAVPGGEPDSSAEPEPFEPYRKCGNN